MRVAGFIFTLALSVAAVTSAWSAAARNPFLGAWTVTDAKVAPWVGAGEQKPVANPSIVHATLTFTAKGVTAPDPLGCEQEVFTVSTVGPDYLFQGGLTDPARQAKELGFTSDKIVSLNAACVRSDADIEIDYALVDANTAVFGLDNIVYVMKRTSAR